MMTPEEYLANLGLKNKQIKIYLDLSSHPESTVVQIHKRVGEPRSSIYLELERMIEKGLIISKRVGKSSYYKITDPETLKLEIEDEKTRIDYLSQYLAEFRTAIEKVDKRGVIGRTINIYKGQAGIKQMLWNIILSGSKLVIGYSPGQLEHVTDRKFAERWRAEFVARGMHNQIIFNQPKPKRWSDIPEFLEKHVQAKTLDERKIKFDRLVVIYGDVFAVCSLKTDVDQYGIEIRDDLLVNSYKQIFQFLWDHVAEEMRD